MRILIVEDNPDAAELLAHLLRRDGGHETLAVQSADEAVAACGRRAFDLLVCDIGLPGCDGWTLLARVRAVRPGIPAIALTGYGRPADVEHSRAAGFDVHLTKPLDSPALAAAIASLTPPNPLTAPPPLAPLPPLPRPAASASAASESASAV